MKSPILPYTLAAGTAVLATAIRDKTIKPTQIVAAFLFGAMVWGLWEWNADVASAFAWVAALTSILMNGRDVIGYVTKGL